MASITLQQTSGPKAYSDYFVCALSARGGLCDMQFAKSVTQTLPSVYWQAAFAHETSHVKPLL